mmetsp:Transcript_5849/g.17515  ORF Transcript_5849/g.17515 Transcript_5849/m.17515 type:complete len:355 (+) Transcript_5849:1457-2521(+)
MLLFPGFANSFHVVATPRGALRVAPVTMADVLVIQNKGGGHGEIGFHLAQHLVSRGDAVTILHEGDGPNPKEAHRAYGELPSDVKVIWGGDLSEAAVCLAKLEGASFSAVVDNWSKSPEAIAPYATAAKAWGVSNYAYVSSAGMYTPDKGDYGAVGEECAVKSSGQRQAEEKIAEMGLPFSYFRPQYIYGPAQGKSYLAFFFDRITRGRPVPVPNGGDQLVTMTHAADNAAMVAAAVGNEAAVGEAFNCATPSLVTYDDLVRLCAGAAGKECEIAHYDPAGFDKPDGFKYKFPFRDTPFYVSADKASRLLGFSPAHSIADDISWYYSEQYVAKGGLDKELDFAEDDVVLGRVPA